MKFTKVNIGKYNGKTLPEIIFTHNDIHWFYNRYYENDFANNNNLVVEAEYIFKRLSRIKIPDNMIVEYVVNESQVFKKLVIKNIKAKENNDPDYDVWLRLEVIDLSFPDQLMSYRKPHSKRIISYMKKYIFGDKNYKLSKKMSEAFFNDDNNFDLYFNHNY